MIDEINEINEINEIPRTLRDSEIESLCQSLVGTPLEEVRLQLSNFINVDWLLVPENGCVLLEIDGEQRREHKRKHYSVEISSLRISSKD